VRVGERHRSDLDRLHALDPRDLASDLPQAPVALTQLITSSVDLGKPHRAPVLVPPERPPVILPSNTRFTQTGELSGTADGTYKRIKAYPYPDPRWGRRRLELPAV
jgi:hypothetical protein